MGTSASATLCFGFPLPEGEASELTEDLSTFVAEKIHGVKPPSGSYSEDPEVKAQWDAWWKIKRDCEKKSGVEIVYHCSDSYPMYILALADSVRKSRQGDTKELGTSVQSESSWEDTLRDFCTKAGIPFIKPQWLLVSYMG